MTSSGNIRSSVNPAIGAYEPIPTPNIRANGSDGPVGINTGRNLSVTVEIDTGGRTGGNADWWVAVNTPFGWYYFDVGTKNWTYAGVSYTDLSPTYQGTII